MTISLRAAVALAAGLGLMACSSDANNTMGWTQARAALASIGSGPKAPARVPQLTPQQVDKSPVRLLFVTVESDGRGTGFGRISSNGGTDTYASLDGITLAMRDGVLVSTRNLPPDLMSSQVPSARQIASGQGSHARSYQILDGADQTQSLRYECHLRREGVETLEIAGRRHATRVVDEICIGDGSVFENRFWIDGSGKIRQSRQWTGTSVGNLRLSDPHG
ncbi:YjbF family lipoprotein [Gemmobacter sp.]|uniref:YjbF family lipoprotein n=1 Tax=Gemmobacter sp. TaxID=1898957 RepID=UPI002AFF3611|nr:YjbF family lipoprotein [Gemmobacter sp.]